LQLTLKAYDFRVCDTFTYVSVPFGSSVIPHCCAVLQITSFLVMKS